MCQLIKYNVETILFEANPVSRCTTGFYSMMWWLSISCHGNCPSLMYCEYCSGWGAPSSSIPHLSVAVCRYTRTGCSSGHRKLGNTVIIIIIFHRFDGDLQPYKKCYTHCKHCHVMSLVQVFAQVNNCIKYKWIYGHDNKIKIKRISHYWQRKLINWWKIGQFPRH